MLEIAVSAWKGSSACRIWLNLLSFNCKHHPPSPNFTSPTSQVFSWKSNLRCNATYCKMGDDAALKTLLKSQGISLSTDKAENGQLDQGRTAKIYDLEPKEASLIQQSKGRSSSSWFRTQAFQACDHGFESRRPHHSATFQSTGEHPKTFFYP